MPRPGGKGHVRESLVRKEVVLRPLSPPTDESEVRAVEERLAFMQMTSASRAALRSLKGLLDRELPIALDKLYDQVRKTPETRGFFDSEDYIARAKGAQTGHWLNISSGDFSGDYASKVRTIGTVHARIGLEPRWYIGGYAIVLDHLIRAAVAEALPDDGADTGNARLMAGFGKALGSLAKATLLDMELAISIYLEEAEKAKQRAHAEAAEALSNMSNGLVMVADDGRIRLHNQRVLELFHLAPGEIGIGMPLSQYLRNVGARVGWDEARTQRVIDNHGRWMAGDSTTQVEHHFDDGTILSISCRPMKDGGAILTYDDVTEAREGQKKIVHMAFHDALTGLPNRRSFAEHLERLLQRSSIAMLMLDLDRFKAVNDTLGHATGDKLLVEVTRRLRDVCRPADLIFRLGGDELAVLTSIEGGWCDTLARDIVTSLSRPFQVEEHTITIGCSVGLAIGRQGSDPRIVPQMADLALYKAKENGRGQVEVYRDGMIEEEARQRRLESDLAQAIAGRQLELHYQPLFELPNRTLAGFEALLRWHHPERGMVPPAEFIPIAEQSGAIVEIGAWVIEEACRQAALWPPHIYVSINVSPIQLRSPGILRRLAKAIERHGLAPRRVEIEVTETALVENSEMIAATLAGLRRLGVRIAMDDFGTGYSSLAHLREFELDRIKIDRSFINTSHTDTSAAAVVRAVTGMARDLSISTTAEGVENEEQLANLIALGCGTAQGYLLGRPIDARAATALMNEETTEDERRVA